MNRIIQVVVEDEELNSRIIVAEFQKSIQESYKKRRIGIKELNLFGAGIVISPVLVYNRNQRFPLTRE